LHQEAYIRNLWKLFDMSVIEWIVIMSLNVNKGRDMPHENIEQLELIQMYHILVQMKILMYYVNYIFFGISFLSILVSVKTFVP